MSRPAGLIKIRDEGRPADRPEHEVAPAEAQGARRIAGVEVELGGGTRDECLELGRVEPDASVVPIDHRARRLEGVERPIAEDFHADLGQDPERRMVDRLDLIAGQDLDRTERVDQRAPWQARQAGCRSAWAAARAVRGLGGCRGRIGRDVHHRMLRAGPALGRGRCEGRVGRAGDSQRHLRDWPLNGHTDGGPVVDLQVA